MNAAETDIRSHRASGAAVAGFSVAAFAATIGDAAFSADRYLDHIKFLASPEMRGRESGSPELEKAAQYIAAQFKADGLKTARMARAICRPSKSPPAPNWARPIASISSRTVRTRRSLQTGKDFVPFNFSARGKGFRRRRVRRLWHHRARIQLRRLRGNRRQGQVRHRARRTSRRNTTKRASSTARSTPITRSTTARPPMPANTARPASS